MSQALRPILRPANLPSLPISSASTTYICQSCRHARLLKRPKRPYTFTQLVTLSDGSAFTMRTTSPVPVYRSSRDTRNAPLWNPSSKELANVEDDEAGRLSGFRARYGSSYNIESGEQIAEAEAETETGDSVSGQADGKDGKAGKVESQTSDSDRRRRKQETSDDELDGMFGEDDEALLEMISNFGKKDQGSASQIARKKI